MSLAELRRRLVDPTRISPHAGVGRPAAVLALLSGDADPEVLFTERAVTLRSQPGQMSFPGGAIDADDPDAVSAALRETHEEIGLPTDRVAVLGALPGVRPTVTRHQVTALVGTWDGTQRLALATDEVAAVHRYRVSELADPAHRVTARHPRGGTGPAFWLDEVVIWGFTAWLTDELIGLGGWQRDWDRARLVDVPDRFNRA